MRAFASFAGGVGYLEETETPSFLNLLDLSAIPLETAHIYCGLIDDWKEFTGTDPAYLLHTFKVMHMCRRSAMNIETCLRGVAEEVAIDLLHEVEDILEAYDVLNDLQFSLLLAPLQSPDCLDPTIKKALECGFAATAKLLEVVRESQPLIRRLSDRWLSLEEELFLPFRFGRQEVWRCAVERGVVFDTLNSTGLQEVITTWGRLAMNFILPSERTGIARISRSLAQELFPDQILERSVEPEDSRKVKVSDPEGEQQYNRPRVAGIHEIFLSVIKQVEAIAKAVEQGQDALARRYLDDLLKSQMNHPRGNTFAVKSLCNIAQQCADMFRTDFENECLMEAIRIKSDDSWAYTQLADHFKRVGRFDEAINALRKAEDLGERYVSKTLLADIYVQMGDLSKGLSIYDSVDSSINDEVIRGAKADLLRKLGKLDEAEIEYNRLKDDGFESHRVIAGRAEIAKRRGQLDLARDLYEGLLRGSNLDESARYVYGLSLAKILLRMGRYSDAFRVTDDAIQIRPFARNAKAIRAAIEALLGDPKAVEHLPSLGQGTAFNEWQYNFVRGLLLLQLDRYGDARNELLRNVEEKFRDKEGYGMLRLGAAVCFLATEDGVIEAASLLDDFPEIEDSFVGAIRAALQYHVAVAKDDERRIEELVSKLRQVKDEGVIELVEAIRRRDWQETRRLEARLVLRAAA